MVGQLSFLTPVGALVLCTAVLPLAALVVMRRRVRRVAQTLGLGVNDGVRPLRALLLVAACGAFALAAAQPYVRITSERSVREDVEAMFVVDVSRSMLAAPGPRGPTRLARAKAEAARLRASIPSVPAGLAGFTDRVLPYAFPTTDERVFASTLREAVLLESPPPQEVSRVITTFAALGELRTGFFSPHARTRICVLLTDGESRSFSADSSGRALGCHLIAVQFWAPAERIYGPDGTPEPQYRPDAAARSTLAAVASGAGGQTFAEQQRSAARRSLLEAVGNAPTKRVAAERRRLALAPWAAFAGLVLVVALVVSAATPGRLQRPFSTQ